MTPDPPGPPSAPKKRAEYVATAHCGWNEIRYCYHDLNWKRISLYG